MTYRDSDDVAPVEEAAVATPSRTALWGRIRGVIRQFRHDLRAPLPETAHLPRWQRIKARVAHLYRRYGWKLFIAIVVYYLIRDSFLYIILPYFIATRVFG